MECPYCECKESNVINSRSVEMNTFRVRICKSCGKQFYTEEVTIEKEEADEYIAAYQREVRLKKGNKKND